MTKKRVKALFFMPLVTKFKSKRGKEDVFTKFHRDKDMRINS